jgi:hypothetical protein
MKYLPWLILTVLVAGGFYLRANQPQLWNDLLSACRAPGTGPMPSDATTNLVAVPAPPPPRLVRIITPDTPLEPSTNVIVTPPAAP